MRPQIAVDLIRPSHEIRDDRTFDRQALQVVVFGFGNYQAVAGEHHGRFHFFG